MTVAKTVLLVEDDVELRDALRDCLDLMGYTVVTADSGREALEYLALSRRAPPDVVVLGLLRAFVNGRALIERIRRDPEIARVPVVVLTASRESVRLSEPIRLQAVIDTVRRYLEAPPVETKSA
jgi:CheY-like chemotaxis protein